jgi:hypothetical protein
MKAQKSYNNLDFLNSPEARSIRMLCEYEEPGARFSAEGVEGTIVFFGSARALPPEVARVRRDQLLREMERALPEDRDRLRKAVGVAEKRLKLSEYYEHSRLLARRLTQWAHDRHEGHKYVICSGGGPGLMEAANRGASDVEGGKSVGLCISLPFEEQSNQYVSPRLVFEFHYFFMRKYWFVFLAKALVAFPGGFGTMDELLECLTLRQTGKMGKAVPIVLFGSEYWKSIFDFEKLVEWGTISPGDLELLHFVDDVDEAYTYITSVLDKVEQGDWDDPVQDVLKERQQIFDRR